MKISGSVIDEDTMNPIIGVNIIVTKDISHNDAEFLTGAATGVDGEYITSKLPIGKYLITFRNIGYKEKTEFIEIEQNSGTLQVNVFLKTESVKK